MVRLALVDDHHIFRFALGSLLSQRGFETVVEASDARSSFPLIDRERPDVVLLDVSLPGMDGVTATRELVARPSSPRVLMLSAYDAPRVVSNAFAAGALGYVLKSHTVDELVTGIDLVARGQRYLAPGLSLQDASQAGPLKELTAREIDIFHMIVKGRTTPEIARELCISPKTVETHRQRVFRKLGVHSAVQLVRFAVVNDLLIPEPGGDDV